MIFVLFGATHLDNKALDGTFVLQGTDHAGPLCLLYEDPYLNNHNLNAYLGPNSKYTLVKVRTHQMLNQVPDS